MGRPPVPRRGVRWKTHRRRLWLLRSAVPWPSRGSRPRLIIHIGAGKAGSSAIQDFLERNADRLEEAGFLLPGDDLSIRPGTARQVGFFNDLRPLDRAKVELFRGRLAQLARLARYRRLAPIISAENLLNEVDGEVQYPDLFAAASDLFDMTVVVYVRRQDDFAIASWTQWHFKATPDFRAWYDRHRGRFADWDTTVSRWERALPAAEFRVRVYDRQRLVGGDVVGDFVAVLGLADEGFERPSDPLVNRSVNEIAARVMVRNRHLFAGGHDHRFMDFLRRYGGDAASAAVDTGLFLTAQERRALVDLYAESNERLRLRHLPELPAGGLFSTDFREAPRVDADTLLERELDLLWTVMFNQYRDRVTRRAQAGRD